MALRVNVRVAAMIMLKVINPTLACPDIEPRFCYAKVVKHPISIVLSINPLIIQPYFIQLPLRRGRLF